ncbi:thioesterase family protein [Herbivorax sp. ANBcel31]|uniref:acyl-CoA thioesterase n=1 Tax=Herbivorax sp. ANBcel31 TaxID=3069754 RepID=UPI0027AFB8E9|nr:thioesterase family protein [Herbivorax sp. ANBcel31]MDQ2085438.1 thioesterase family protein [Herbivorax sp. ANBcel31]
MKIQKMKHSTIDIRIRLAETDPYGIAHHSNYFTWFEEGRFDYFEKNTYEVSDMKNNSDVVYCNLSIKCKFLKSVGFKDEIQVKTYMSQPSIYARYLFQQEIINKKTGEKVAECNSTMAGLSRKNWEIITLPEDEN